MSKCSFEIKNIGNYSYGYCHMVCDGDNFWLSAYDTNSIIRWNESTNETKEYHLPIEPGYKAKSVFSNLINLEDEIIVCYRYCVHMAVINKKNGECRQHSLIDKILKEMKNNSFGVVGGLVVINSPEKNTILILNERNSILYVWNIETNQWKKYPLRVDKEEMLRTEKRLLETIFIERATPYHIKETPWMLMQFIDYIQGAHSDVFKKEYECYNKRKSNDTIGKQIHDCINI